MLERVSKEMLLLQDLSVSTKDILGKHLTSPVLRIVLGITLEFVSLQLKTSVH